jgi:hypothetical protein
MQAQESDFGPSRSKQRWPIIALCRCKRGRLKFRVTRASHAPRKKPTVPKQADLEFHSSSQPSLFHGGIQHVLFYCGLFWNKCRGLLGDFLFFVQFWDMDFCWGIVWMLLYIYLFYFDIFVYVGQGEFWTKNRNHGNLFLIFLTWFRIFL